MSHYISKFTDGLNCVTTSVEKLKFDADAVIREVTNESHKYYKEYNTKMKEYKEQNLTKLHKGIGKKSKEEYDNNMYDRHLCYKQSIFDFMFYCYSFHDKFLYKVAKSLFLFIQGFKHNGDLWKDHYPNGQVCSPTKTFYDNLRETVSAMDEHQINSNENQKNLKLRNAERWAGNYYINPYRDQYQGRMYLFKPRKTTKKISNLLKEDIQEVYIVYNHKFNSLKIYNGILSDVNSEYGKELYYLVQVNSIIPQEDHGKNRPYCFLLRYANLVKKDLTTKLSNGSERLEKDTDDGINYSEFYLQAKTRQEYEYWMQIFEGNVKAIDENINKRPIVINSDTFRFLKYRV